MKKILSAALLSSAILVSAEVRNGDFSRVGGTPPSAASVKKASEKNQCPEKKNWANSWGCLGTGGTLDFPRDPNGNRFARISGKNFVLSGYHALNIAGPKKVSIGVSLRGKGTVRISFWCFRREGKAVKGMPRGASPITVKVDSETWTKYLFPLQKKDETALIHPVFTAVEGTIDIDNVFIYSQKDYSDYYAVAEAENQLRKTNMFRAGSNSDYAVDSALKPAIEAYKKQDLALQAFVKKNPENALAAKLLKQSDILRPYLLTDGVTKIGKDRLNRAAALCIAIEKITGSVVKLAPAAEASVKDKKKIIKAAPAAVETGKILITNVKPGKLLYVENENGGVSFTITNPSQKNVPVVLETIIHSGINDKRTVQKTNLTLAPGAKKHSVAFNVGPESFGKEVELKLFDSRGKLITSAREYFQAHTEFMRVMMHGTSRYQNFVHYFAHEQTDFGVQTTDDKIYLSCQPLYKINKAAYHRRIKTLKQNRALKISFYQNRSFGGKIGLEEVRKHPEYLLYAESGQPEADPFYGGLPNPFEIAAPAELEPERRKKLLGGKKFLDVRLTSWQHYSSDFTNMKCLEYGAKCIRDYQKVANIDVMYLDGTPSVVPGYTWEGKFNIAGMDRNDIAALNAKIATKWNSELRKDNPNAGSWCNGISPTAIRWFRGLGMWEKTMGMGIDIDKGQDVSDVYVKAMTSAYNSACLSEVQHIFMENSDIPDRDPAVWRNTLLERRDYLIQKYKANVVYGYLFIPSDSNISKVKREYAWPTINYFHALTVATQHHHILYGYVPGIPAVQPFDQFMTRYSGLIWDKELIAMPKKDAEKMIRLESGKELDWKDFVYTRKYDDSDALIIHVVRPYPLKKWDLNWEFPATILKDVKAEITIPVGKKAVVVKAMRPYLPDEKEEIVEKEIPFNVSGGKLSFRVPDFSYYTMLAVKFQ